MSTTRNALFTLAALGLAALAAHPASAQTMITVFNGDFSLPLASGNYQGGDYTTGQQIAGWSDPASVPGNSGYGVQKDNPAFYNTAPDPDGGSQFLYVNQGNVTSNTISLGTYLPGTIFTVSGNVLHRLDGYGAGIGTISLFSVNANGSLGTLLTQATSTPAALGNYNFVSATYTSAVAPSQVAIVLSAPTAGNVQSDYDSIRLSSNNAPISPAPEPAQIGVLALVALGLGALAFKARKRSTAAQAA